MIAAVLLAFAAVAAAVNVAPGLDTMVVPRTSVSGALAWMRGLLAGVSNAGALVAGVAGARVTSCHMPISRARRLNAAS